MTRKHFVAIAEALASTKPTGGKCQPDNSIGEVRYLQWERDCHRIADSIGQFNDSFNRSTFLDACGVE